MNPADAFIPCPQATSCQHLVTVQVACFAFQVDRRPNLLLHLASKHAGPRHHCVQLQHLCNHGPCECVLLKSQGKSNATGPAMLCYMMWHAGACCKPKRSAPNVALPKLMLPYRPGNAFRTLNKSSCSKQAFSIPLVRAEIN